MDSLKAALMPHGDSLAPDGASADQRAPLLGSAGDAGPPGFVFPQREAHRQSLTPEKYKGFSTSVARPSQSTESLDFEPIHNNITQMKANSALYKRKFYGYTGATLVKYTVTIVTGILTGACAFAVVRTSTRLLSYRLDLAHRELHHEGRGSTANLFASAGALTLTSLIMVLVPGLLVQLWTPQAAGAGVSLVMAYLNGNDIPYLLHWHVMLTKVIGTIASCASSLPLGPEGPMVHIGACLGSTLTYCECCTAGSAVCCLGPSCGRRRARKKNKRVIKTSRSGDAVANHFCEQIVNQNDADHREIISAGAAAGLAAAFGSPIGGVMFAWEEASSYWSRKVTWRCFIATATAVLTLALLRQSESIGILSFPSFTRSKGHGDSHTVFLTNLPFLCVTAMAAGVIGAAFNTTRGFLSRVRPSADSHAYRVFELLVFTAFSVAAMFFLALWKGNCIEPHKSWPEGYGLQLRCEPGQANDLFTLYFGNPEETIDRIFAAGQDVCDEASHHGIKLGCTFTIRSLILHCLCYAVFMSFAAGLSIPGGLFMPCIMVGSSFGLISGRMLQYALPSWNISPSMYALVGATAMLGGVFRASISLVVVVVEGTRQINYIFQVMLAVVMSNWVAHHIHSEGVYESDLERNGSVSFLRPEPPKALQAANVSQIMAKSVVGVREVETVERVLQLLKYTSHNGFPVFRGSLPGAKTRRLEGLILRSQIIVMLHHRAFCDKDGNLLSTSAEETVQWQLALEHEMNTFHQRQGLWKRHLWSSKELLHELELEGNIMKGIQESLRNITEGVGGVEAEIGPSAQPAGAQLYLNFRSFMNRAPIAVRGESSAARAYMLFTAMGMRHLCVNDANNNVIGILTRKDLDKAAGQGWWRHSAISVLQSRLDSSMGMRDIV